MTRLFLFFIGHFLFIAVSSGQFNNNGKHINYSHYKAKPYYFGISLGYDNSNLFLKRSNYFVNDNRYLVVEPSSGIGFHVQMIINLKLGEDFDIRVLPGFSFADKKIDYFADLTGKLTKDKRFESVLIDFPILARYKSKPYNDMRAYVLSGVRYTYDVNSNAQHRNNQDLIKISPHDFMFEVGGGMQFFFPYFIFSPEIKISTGIGNVLQYDKQLHESKVLEKILTRALSISFHFEG